MKTPSLFRLPFFAAAAALPLALSPALEAAQNKPGVTIQWEDRVPPPAAIDAKYTPQGLMVGFDALCKKLRYRPLHVEVDESEFPFLLHGVLAGDCDYKKIRDTLNTMPGYAYVGSTTAKHDGVTYFVLNMTPRDKYPRQHANAINARLMERLKTLMTTLRAQRK